MMKMDGTRLFVLISSALGCVMMVMTQEIYPQPVPPSMRDKATPGGLRGQGPYTNLTMDQIIMDSMGGVADAPSMIVQDGKVLAELDMMLSEDQFLRLYEFPSSKLLMGASRKKRKAVREVNLRWSQGVIPYEIYPGHFDASETYWVTRAMTEWERYTCLRFKPAIYDHNRIRLQNGRGCNSELGMVGGTQMVNLARPGCRFKGLYLHELGHAIGLVHEHQLPNRDDYIQVIYQNVEPSMRIWFNKYNSREVNQFDIPYEYSSAMHYGITAFSYDGKSQTIRAKYPDKEDDIGQVFRKELSFTDVKTVNLMYKCSAPCSKSIVCTVGGFVDQNCKCICPDGTNDCQVRTASEPLLNKEEEGCENSLGNSWQCSVWANQGECDRNPTFMKEYCNKACGYCGRRSRPSEVHEGMRLMTFGFKMTRFFTDLVPKIENMEICKDSFLADKCKKFVKRGDCLTNPTWMKENCKKSCRFCDGISYNPVDSCQNVYLDDTKCDQWALEGECEINPSWMKTNCERACHLCEEVAKPTTGGGGGGTGGGGGGSEETCTNKHKDDAQCTAWAQNGECSNNPSWMGEHCAKDCGTCAEGGPCVNLHNAVHCRQWAENQECIKNPSWMMENCRLACGDCKSTGTVGTARTTPPIKRTTTPTTTQTPEPGSCTDTHDHTQCKLWADAGHCERNPAWMNKNCQQSCGKCPVTGGGGDSGGGGGDSGGGDSGGGDSGGGEDNPCEDTNEQCGTWKKSKFCVSNPGYMLTYCRKSCNNCDNKCTDTHQLCATWGKGGHCTSNASYMLRYCQETCHVCDM